MIDRGNIVLVAVLVAFFACLGLMRMHEKTSCIEARCNWVDSNCICKESR